MDGRWDEGYDLVISVAPPPALHHLPLASLRRLTSARTPPHHVHDDTRGLGHHGEADVLLHQAQARTRGRGHRLRSSVRCTDHRRHGPEFVLELDESASDVGKPQRHPLSYLARWRYRVGCIELAAGGYRPLRTGPISMYKICSGQHFTRHASLTTARTKSEAHCQMRPHENRIAAMLDLETYRHEPPTNLFDLDRFWLRLRVRSLLSPLFHWKRFKDGE